MAVLGGAAQPVYFTNSPPLGGGAAQPVVLMASDGVTPLATLNQPASANQVLAGPSSGAAATPAFRALVAADLPQQPIVVPLVYDTSLASVSWASQPAALTEFPTVPRTRTKVDLTNYTQARLSVVVVAAGVAGAELRVQYSLDQSTWDYLDASAGPAISLNNTATLVVSGWVNLTAAAKADAFLRLTGINGNASASPAIAAANVQFR